MVKYRVKGATLLELIAVLTLASLFLLAGIAGISNSVSRTVGTTSTISNVNIVLRALDNFYEENCASSFGPLPNSSLLVSQGYIMGAEAFVNYFGNDLVPEILWGNPTRVRVRAEIIGVSDLDALMASLDTDYRIGSVFYWERLPHIRYREYGIELIQFKQRHEPGVCL